MRLWVGPAALAATVALVGCSSSPVREATKVREQQGQVATLDGVKLGYRKVSGGGQTVVVLHGGPGFRRVPLRTLRAPTLIIHGAADPIPEASAHEWAQTLPNARLLVLRNVGPFPYLEAPSIFFPAVESFIGGDWPEAAVSR